jgi:diguanylate cyclase (GGDEF)-like protein/PAS domain S-box-containing protein
MPFAGTHITLVWLPTGIAVAALLLWGRSVWPSIYLTAFLVNLSIGSPWYLAAGIAVGNTLAPLLTVAWLKRLHFHPDFDHQKDVASFISASSLGMLASAACGVINLYLSGLLPAKLIGSAGLSWWMGDTVGVLLAAPLLFTFNRKNLAQLNRDRWALLLWLLVAVPVAWLAFMQQYQSTGSSLPLAFLTLPLFAWAALRFGVTGAGLAGLGFSIIAAWGTAMGHGTFFLQDPQISLFLLWAYMASTVLTGLLITAMQAERLQVENILRDSEQRLHALTESRQAILDGSNFSIISTDPSGLIQSFNHSAERMLGYSATEVEGKQTPSIFHDKDEVIARARELSHELNITVPPGFEAFAAKARLQRTPDEHEWTYIRKDGSRFPVLLSITAMLDKHADITGYLGIAIDVSERKQQEARLRDSEELFRALYDSSSDAHMLTTLEQGFISGNQAAADLFGCSDIAHFVTLSPAVTSPEFQTDGRRSDEKAQEMMRLAMDNGKHTFEWLHKRLDGSEFAADVLLTRITIGGKIKLQATVRDITLRKAIEAEVSRLAFYDVLTGLPNRRLLMDRLQQAIAICTRNVCQGALMFIDLDHFKQLNDTFGHDKGDLLLQQVARRLGSCVREVDTVARLGGDEFVVLLDQLSEQSETAAMQAQNIAEKILGSLNQSYDLDGHIHRNTSSIGVTLISNLNQDVAQLLKRADLAMYQAKSEGRNCLRFYDPVIQAKVISDGAMKMALAQGIQKNQLTLYFQAQFDDQQQISGVEALVRWRHPQRGLLEPAEFLPLAEETRLMLALDAWVLKNACQQLAAWAGHVETCHLSMAVNVSASQFRHPDYVKQVLALFEDTGADPSKLRLEITESALLDEVEDNIIKMLRLQSYGISFSLDDFGIGYSSLAYLKRLPLKQLNIGRAFVRTMLTEQKDAAIVKTIIALGESLGLTVIAEGVETDEQRQFLLQHHCRLYQGYLFSRALPSTEFETFMRSHRGN